MTDEEYDALDEVLTRTVPKLGKNGTGWLAQREMRLLGLTTMTINYLFTKAEADNKPLPKLLTNLYTKRLPPLCEILAK